MSLDYKYSKQKAKPRRFAKRLRKRALLAAGIALFVVLLIYGLLELQIRRTDDQILTGQYQEALQTLQYLKQIPVFNGRMHERVGVAELLLNGKKEAEPHFRLARSKPLFAPVDYWQQILKTLWTHARYEEGLFYVEHIQRDVKEHPLLFYKAGFLTGINRLEEAKQTAATAGKAQQFEKEAENLQREIEHRLTSGQYSFLYDRQNLPLVSRSLKGEFKILYEPVKTVLRTPSGDYLHKLDDRAGRQATTTLDYRIQTAALNALQEYAGAIVLLDVKTGDILAAASSLKGYKNAHPPGTSVATHAQYEPGSIIKMITLAGALERNANPQQFFPFHCEGILRLRDNQFMYCWKAHNVLKDFGAATAVSCNTSFARIGLSLKPSELIANLRTFGFDSKLPDASLPFELGKVLPGKVDDLYISNLSIGLDELTITPLHAAMVSAAVANEGISMTPRLLLNYRNVLGVPYSAPAPVPFRRFMQKETAMTLKKAMEQVVLDPEGTGRRAAIPGLPIAMKTGTAGEGAKGYNAIIMGFAPVENPKVAFSIVAEHSGKAEFEAARITKLFLETIQGYIQ